MRRLICFLAALPLLVSSPAFGAQLTFAGATAMSNDCQTKPYAVGEISSARRFVSNPANWPAGAMNAVAIGEINATDNRLAECEVREEFLLAIQRADRSCEHLVASEVRMIDVGHAFLTSGLTSVRNLFRDSLRSLHPAIERCWRSLASTCFNLGDPAIAGWLTTVLQVVRDTGYPIDRLQPPMRACNSTIPTCSKLLTFEECVNYMRDVTNVLFLSNGAFDIVSNIRQTPAGP